MNTYAAIDLHSRNNYIGILDEKGKRLFDKRMPNNLTDVLTVLEPFKESLEGVVVESTYNWYWLVDGLQENSYTVHLANPAAVQVYSGMKYTDDKWDSFWLANLLRLNLLPEGYIYPKEQRPVRDLLRRRLLFVRQRTAHILSLQSMLTRNVGKNYSGNAIKCLTETDIEALLDHKNLVFAARKSLETILFLGRVVKEIEAEVKSQVKLKKEFQLLRTITGIGDILALTIMLEVGDIRRFPNANHYSSYCRCVEGKRISNGKKKGKPNQKNGNKYLAWAYVEAANVCQRYCPLAHRFFQRKMAKSNRALATKALANKLTKASYFVMRDQVSYDADDLFRRQTGGGRKPNA